MNLVMDDAEEVILKENSRRHIGKSTMYTHVLLFDVHTFEQVDCYYVETMSLL